MTQPRPTASPVPAAKGTRDVYPQAMLARRYLTGLWRDTAIRHGFEEVDGPTFEMLELYTRKSGEGIVSELFRFRRQGGEDDYALRPEFTPTLARMYAARAASLPSPTKWFSIGPYFRAEKPQRGRLREFLQWNVDVLGEGQAPAERDALSCLTASLERAGVRGGNATIRISDRRRIARALLDAGVTQDRMGDALLLLDKKDKITQEDFRTRAGQLGMSPSAAEGFLAGRPAVDFEGLDLTARLAHVGYGAGWFAYDPSIVRGLAYYTGTVFEVIAEGERAIAGGGRYDNLIELMGGPPTPAVGFAMGDVVLGLLLEDKGLMPEGAELLDALSRPGASLRPEAFVVAGSEDEDALVEPLLANLRRGIEREAFDGKPWAADRYAVRPLHARRTYKTTRNLKKLLADAERQHARFAVVLHGPDKVQLKDLDRREDIAHEQAGDFSVDPASPAYVGQAIAGRAAVTSR